MGRDIQLFPQGATSVSVYFPGSGPWYDVWTMEKVELTGAHNMPAPYEKVIKSFLHCQIGVLAMNYKLACQASLF